MTHPTHKLKAYMADHRKPLIFCTECGKEEDEGLNEPCNKTFYENKVDTEILIPYPVFVSGLE